MKILVTNDDGIQAPGLAALAEAMTTLGDVDVVAPSQGRSCASHGITFVEPLTAQELRIGDSQKGWGVSGTPADCVKLALHELLPSSPDLVVSGINAGANRGVDVLYSGTVAAAAEAALMGIPAVAVSLEKSEAFDFAGAAAWCLQALAPVLSTGFPRGRVLNINIPAPRAGGPKGIRLVPQSLRPWKDGYDRRQDPRGRDYYWLTAAEPTPDPQNPSDLGALAEGWVTVTPLQFDLTATDQMTAWEDLW